MGEIDANKLRQCAPKTSSLIIAGKTKKSTEGKKSSAAKIKKDIKFSLPNKKEFRKLLSVYEKKIKAGDVILLFKDGHWKAVSSKEPALKKLGDAIKYSFSKEYDKDVTKFAKAAGLAPYTLFTGKYELFKSSNSLEFAGTNTGILLYSIPLFAGGLELLAAVPFEEGTIAGVAKILVGTSISAVGSVGAVGSTVVNIHSLKKQLRD